MERPAKDPDADLSRGDAENQVLLEADVPEVHGSSMRSRWALSACAAVGVLGLVVVAINLLKPTGISLQGGWQQISMESEEPSQQEGRQQMPSAEEIWGMLKDARAQQPKALRSLHDRLLTAEGRDFLSELMADEVQPDPLRIQALFENASVGPPRQLQDELPPGHGTPSFKYQTYMSKCSLTAFSMYLLFGKIVIASTTLDKACNTEDSVYFWEKKTYNPKVCAAAISGIIDLIVWMTSFIPLVVNFCGVTSLPHSWCAGDTFWFMGNSMDVVVDSLGIATGDCASPAAIQNNTNTSLTVKIEKAVKGMLKRFAAKKNAEGVDSATNTSRRLSTLPAPEWLQPKTSSHLAALLRDLKGSQSSQASQASQGAQGSQGSQGPQGSPDAEPSDDQDSYKLDDGKLIDLSSQVQLGHSFTLEGWIKPTGDGGPLLTFSSPAQRMVMFNGQQRNSTVKEEVLQLFLTKNNTPGLIAENLTGHWVAIANGKSLKKDEWYHIAFELDAASQISRAFCQGKQVASTQRTREKLEAFAIAHVPVGEIQIGGSSYWSRFFQGEVSQIRLSNISRYGPSGYDVSKATEQDPYTHFLLGSEFKDRVTGLRLQTMGMVDKAKVNYQNLQYGPQAGFNALLISNPTRRIATCVFQTQSMVDGLAKLGISFWKIVHDCKALDSPTATQLNQQTCAGMVINILSMMSGTAMSAAGVASSCPDEMAEHSFCVMDITSMVAALLSFGEWGSDITGDCSSEKSWVAKGPGSPDMPLYPDGQAFRHA